MYPDVQLKRLRRTPALRDLVRETHVSVDDLIYPIFIEEEITEAVEVSSMPGVFRHPEAQIDKVIKDVAKAGVKAVMLFGVSHHKDASGSDSLKEEGLLARMVRAAKKAVPDMVVMADCCFCEYTDHGHCGVPDSVGVDNTQTLPNLAQQAVVAAQAGADVVAPSAMLDGQVVAMRVALDKAGFEHVPIMSYSTKFASSFYGPFRAAAGCDLKGDRKTYQMDPANGREALLESVLDETEGADILMVKPGMPYLDVISKLREQTLLPVAAYQVSGEYAMLKFAAKEGALDEKKTVMESLLSFKRAGANLILTYYACDVAKWLAE